MSGESALFQYGAPFVGVLLIAIGIAGAVPGGYALIEPDVENCGDPTIGIESPAATAERFAGEGPRPRVTRLSFDELSEAEQIAFREARADAVGEAQVTGAMSNRAALRNGTLVTYEGDRYYVRIVAENACFDAVPLQFPLGVFAIALGFIGIITPPLYRRLVRLERRARR